MRRVVSLIPPMLLVLPAFAQGLLNNGAKIVMMPSASANTYIYIDGSSGHFTNQDAGLNTGQVLTSTSTGRTGIIDVNGNWVNNSAGNVFTSNNGTVELVGAAQSIGGSTTTYFNNLTLLGTGTKTLNLNTLAGGGFASAAGVLSVGTRVLDLNGYLLTMNNPAGSGITYSSGYIQSETNASVNTSIIKWNMGTNTGAHVYPFGVGGAQIPFTFNKTTAGASDISVSTRATSATNNTPWAGASNLAAVSHMYDPTIGGDGSVQAVIDRWWDITTSAAVTADVTFTYRGSENTMLPLYQSGALGAQHWNGTGWDPPVGSGTGVTSGTGSVTVTGANTFSPWVVSSMSAPLPIELLSFTSECAGSSVRLNWTTATETSNDYFTVERSYDGTTFESIAIVDGSGTTTSVHHYTATDNTATGAVAYYRLRQTDLDGRFSYSGVIASDCRSSNEWMYASAAGNDLNVVFSVSEGDYVLSLYDVTGRELSSKLIGAAAGRNTVVIPGGIYSQGIYLLTLRSEAHVITAKVIVR